MMSNVSIYLYVFSEDGIERTLPKTDEAAESVERETKSESEIWKVKWFYRRI